MVKFDRLRPCVKVSGRSIGQVVSASNDSSITTGRFRLGFGSLGACSSSL